MAESSSSVGLEPSTLNIKDEKLGLPRVCWKKGNDLVVFGSAGKFPPQATGTGRGLKPGNSSLLHEVMWDVSLYNNHARKLISESNTIFLASQKLGDDCEPTSRRKQLVNISRKYRSVVKEFVDNLQQGADVEENDALRANYEAQGQVFYKVELIWNLCEILFIDVKPGGALLVQLLDWVRWHFSECEDLAMKVMKSGDPSSHHCYWDAVYGYVLQGRIDEVRKLLRAHRSSKSECFILMDELLKKMPTYASYSSSSMPEFQLRWHQWQEECEIRLERGEFNSQPDLELVCKLLCGRLDTFLEMMHLCETWYHLMVSRLLYSNPFVKADDLQRLAHEYVEVCGGMCSMGTLDEILLLTMEFNVLEVIKRSSQHLDSWWFVAHLVDLLQRVDVGLCAETGEVSLREFLLLEYAAVLASHDSLWQFAVDYYDSCPVHGTAMLEACLERVPLTTEWKANLLVELALRRNLVECARSICKVMGQRAIRNGRLGSALSWVLKSKDAVFATYLADKFLAEYSSHGQFHSLSLLDNLGSSMFVSNRLVFLAKYREFHRLYENKEFHQAGSILYLLLTSNLTPKVFKQTLLVDSITLLEANELIFNTQQTHDLMYCLEELMSSETADDLDKTTEQILQLAMARNLMRAYLQDGADE